MKKENFKYYVMMAAIAAGVELPPAECAMLNKFLRGEDNLTA